MTNNIIILDDVIPQRYQDEIEKAMIGENNSTAWFLQHDISYNNQRTDIKMENKTPGFSHVFFNESGVVSGLFNFMLPMVYTALDKDNKELKQILLARSFLQFPGTNSKKNNPHVDLESDHLVCLYYVNEADGDTVIYNETFQDISKDNLKLENLTILKQVSPKKGRVILFQGNHYHSSSTPTTGLRCIINFDVLTS